MSCENNGSGPRSGRDTSGCKHVETLLLIGEITYLFLFRHGRPVGSAPPGLANNTEGKFHSPRCSHARVCVLIILRNGCDITHV